MQDEKSHRSWDNDICTQLAEGNKQMQETIQKILSEVKDTPIATINLSDETDIINDIGLDSLQMVTFMLKLEEELDIQIDFDNLDFTTLMSVRSLCDFLSKQPVYP